MIAISVSALESRARDWPISGLLTAAAVTIIGAVAIGMWLRSIEAPECKAPPRSLSGSFGRSVELAQDGCARLTEPLPLPLRREIGP